MKLRFTQRATEDLGEIGYYIQQRNPQAAKRVRTAILNSLQILIMFPLAGRQQKVEGVRKLMTRRYPYFVYYTFDEDSEEIVILAIQHAAREQDHSDA